MKKKEKVRVLFISQEITPYLDETPMGLTGRKLPQGIQERGKEIRTFMPKFGCINERRNQLHEVIRLSGMNLIINNTDHQLIIKVASIPSARMQVYFIDNQEYFERKHILKDKKGQTKTEWGTFAKVAKTHDDTKKTGKIANIFEKKEAEANKSKHNEIEKKEILMINFRRGIGDIITTKSSKR